MFKYEAKNPTDGTGNYISGTSVALENSESIVTHTEEEVYIEAEVMHVTEEALGGETKLVQAYYY